MKREVLELSDHRMFERCFRDNYQTLCYFASNILNDDTAAEDAVQDVFIKLLRLGRSFNSEEHLKNYLYQAVHNQCMSKKRQDDKVQLIDIDGVKNLSLDPMTEAHLIRTEIIAEIRKAVESLPDRCREVFRLAYMEGKSNDEIAEILNVQKNTVKVQKQRAKQHLRETLKDLYPLLIFLIKMY